ncbi:MAG: family 78 glycoside hydrolase catalytic domain [Clostridia bacterium]|nr:family 78 glycoside hydrolase catalytic domain [Clostridia bacterium]
MLKNLKFITLEDKIERGLFDSPAVLLRKKFHLNKKNGRYTVKVCGLGYGVYYLNGIIITSDVLITPVSDYRKTLWYSEYDITSLIKDGENVFFAKLGNGFYNENFESAWHYNNVEWRTIPCLWAEIYENDKLVLMTDDSWKGRFDPATFYNQLRSGEYYDSRKELSAENINFDDVEWENACFAAKQPQGKLRLCFGPTIKECEKLYPTSVYKNINGIVFDFGRNISGYVEITVSGRSGDEITLSYAEEIYEDNTLKLNGLGIYYPSVPCQVDKFICNGKTTHWKPKFTYHGFRYVQVSGLTNETDIKDITALFVHQDIDRISDFYCSDESINKLYQAGIASTFSNMFYSLTDCPTREKLGWLNDAQASLGQIMLNFDCENFFKKWIVDIIDTMHSDGNISGIAPSPDWGYDYGVVTNAAIITIPYMLYKYKSDNLTIRDAFPYMDKYYKYHCNNIGNSNLGDWTGAKNLNTPVEFIDLTYAFIFSEILSKTAKIAGADSNIYQSNVKKYKSEIEKKYFNGGKCLIEEQTPLACAIVLNFGDREKISEQLINAVKNKDKHIACGMFGIQFLYKALFEINAADLWYEMILNKTAPSFKVWTDKGATTLFETFDESAKTISRNHHMFSNVIEEFITQILGIKVIDAEKGRFEISPAVISKLNFAKGFIKIPYRKNATINVEWSTVSKERKIKITASGDIYVSYKNYLIIGEREFNEKEEI